jgi:hypothetical protein
MILRWFGGDEAVLCLDAKNLKRGYEHYRLLTVMTGAIDMLNLYLCEKLKTFHMKKKYMNPYMAGTMLGIVLLLAMFLAGRGLGASGGLKYCVVSIVGAVDRPHADGSIYYSKYFEDGKKPLKNWLTIEILGVVAGGFLSGAVSKRLKFKIEKSPKISNSRRVVFAFLGGVFFVYGAQLARGCTSGAALSGMAVLSVAGFVTMVAIFGSAYLFAWFFRKNWI